MALEGVDELVKIDFKSPIARVKYRAKFFNCWNNTFKFIMIIIYNGKK